MSKTLTIKACGCMVKSDGQVFIIYCSKHKAAPEMYEALDKTAALLEDIFEYREHPDEIAIARAALKNARGE